MKTNVARHIGLSILMSKIIVGNFLSHLMFQNLAEVDYSYNIKKHLNHKINHSNKTVKM